jgi:hypothetical protein
MSLLSRFALPVLSLALTVLASGCCDPSSGPVTNAVFCSTEADCPSGSVCAYAVDQACSAAGQCAPLQEATEGCTSVQQIACDCSGQTVSWSSGCAGLPEGQAPAPIAHANPCGG